MKKSFRDVFNVTDGVRLTAQDIQYNTEQQTLSEIKQKNQIK